MYHGDSEVRRQMAREHAEVLAREYRPMPPAPEAEAQSAEKGVKASLRRLRRRRVGRAHASGA
jgi:hypothetical protein